MIDASPLMRIADLSVGEEQTVTLHDGAPAILKLVAVDERRDPYLGAIRQAYVDIELNGESWTLPVAGQYLPRQLGAVQIDCPLTAGFTRRASRDISQLRKDARFRLWPATSPLAAEGSLIYPVKRRWLSDRPQVCNEPCYLNGEPTDPNEPIPYHAGYDIGGPEGMVDVYSATDGLVYSARGVVLEGYALAPPFSGGPPRDTDLSDFIRVRDARGWTITYGHLASIDEAIEVGSHIKQGQRLGIMGKEGPSGGWCHLHFGIKGMQPSNEQGAIDEYALLWEAYRREHGITLQAIGGPHLYTGIGEPCTLDATRSWSAKGWSHIASCHWHLTDGRRVDGGSVEYQYARPGMYSELFCITDHDGNVDWGQVTVVVVRGDDPNYHSPGITATYEPTLGLRAGQEITFQVRSYGFAEDSGGEAWDFGDGSPAVVVHSYGGSKEPHAANGYATTTHRFREAGTFIVCVTREGEQGDIAQERMALVIEE